MKSVAIGKITPIKAYQTTDGKKFVGENAETEAKNHQRVINTVKNIKI